MNYVMDIRTEEVAKILMTASIRGAANVMTMREISEFCQDTVNQIVMDTAEMDECF